MNLSHEQQIAFDKYINKENIFITGPGGSGKSYLINEIVRHAKENDIKYNVCALTGCAAILLNCKAKTLHSWAGIGLGKGEKMEERLFINKSKKIKGQKDIFIANEPKYNLQSIKNLIENLARHLNHYDEKKLIFKMRVFLKKEI